MKQIILLLVLQFFVLISYSQIKDTLILKRSVCCENCETIKCVYGDSKYMEIHPNGKIYRFKHGLDDGVYQAFIDDNFIDTAMIICVIDNDYSGLLIRWYNGRIAEECEYKNGLMDGWRKLYLYDEEYGEFLNIEKCENGYCKEVYTEW